MNLANHFNAYSLNNLIVSEIEENKNEETSTHNENCKTTETAEVAKLDNKCRKNKFTIYLFISCLYYQ